MGLIKGQIEYNKWKTGVEITRKEAILANCYMCNGLEESSADCQGKNCPMYQYQPYRRVDLAFASNHGAEEGLNCHSQHN